MSYIRPEEFGCLGKAGYDTKRQALLARQRMVQRNRRPKVTHKQKGRGLAALEPYPCTICEQWHLGNAGGGRVPR